ncbi:MULTISPECIES: DUF3422 domain-containing protein [unclassified Neptuniibacter]|uniref:DUF3422 family protein n=1 Tax=unclassified Neptuniibacter TaxID=2630693 RepID=UPI000C4A7734|nr:MULTISPECIES: DUF3422 domain-containing protein [unclassified Neptuniibacter]MAY42939.1 hypothetical protein [Oceanospirillaceae bacterium]|tara:strand:- start:10842 stop:12188 length:1347 start_codon:yes stop_codon:yes gene_type:complete
MEQPVNAYGLQMHPMREALYSELHSRPFQVIPSPARITHLAVMCNSDQSAAQFEHLKELYEHFGVTPPENDELCYHADFGKLRVRREKHMEFTAYTFINTDIEQGGNPFEVTGLTPLPEGWLANIPGTVLSAFHISVEDSRQTQELNLPLVKRFFEGMRLVGSSPQDGDARVWTTFQTHSDSFGRFLIYNKQMSDSQLGRLIQRLIEIEVYRLMCLLSLPTAREINPTLNAMDQKLADITDHLAHSTDIDEQALLGRLTDMASWVEDCRARATFRFSATYAYHDLVIKRLEELREDEVSGHLTITEFMTRRLTPAVKTCRATSNRLEDLSRRIDRVAEMMRTRVELSIQSQNQELLASMDQRSKVQLMMQHTVEGLSVAAISYYTIGLIKYLLDALYNTGVELNKDLIMGISVPVVIGIVAFTTRKIHKHFLKLAIDQAAKAENESKV